MTAVNVSITSICVDEEPVPPLPRDCRSIMGMAFTIHTLPEPDRTQQIDCSGLQHPGSNPQQDMLAALPFQHDAIDAVSIKDMGQKQSRRPAADDCHLGSHRQLHYRLSQTECDFKQGPIAKNRKRLSFRSRAINQMHRLPLMEGSGRAPASK
jgi:hypothetical protein